MKLQLWMSPQNRVLRNLRRLIGPTQLLRYPHETISGAVTVWQTWPGFSTCAANSCCIFRPATLVRNLAFPNSTSGRWRLPVKSSTLCWPSSGSSTSGRPILAGGRGGYYGRIDNFSCNLTLSLKSAFTGPRLPYRLSWPPSWTRRRSLSRASTPSTGICLGRPQDSSRNSCPPSSCCLPATNLSGT